MKPIRLEVPLPTMPSRANAKSGDTHWARQRLVKRQNKVFHEALLQVRGQQDQVQLPVDVLITRISPRPLDDDNLRQSCKSFRDSLAKYLRLKDDRDERVRWEYSQAIDGRPKYVAVRFLIVPRCNCLCCGQSMLSSTEDARGVPWPLESILKTLADAADHLLDNHNCDAHGHEQVAAARDAAKELLRKL